MSIAAQPSAEPQPRQHGSALCVTCGTLLEGEYCHECGEKQPHDHDLTVSHFAHDAWHELVHIDSKIWRTLKAIAVQPGFLTTEYKAGRKNRYVRPLRMYIILFAANMLLYTTGTNTKTYDVERILQAERAREASQGAPITGPANTGTTVNFKAGSANPTGSRNMTSAVEKMIERKLRKDGYLNVSKDSELYRLAKAASLERMTRNWQSYTSMLQLVQPLVLSLGLMLLFWGRKLHYVEHLVMALHLLCFQYLFSLAWWPFYSVTGLDPMVDRSPALMGVTILVSMAYMWLALRRFYQESKVKTTVKAIVGYGILFAGMVVPISIALIVAVVFS